MTINAMYSVYEFFPDGKSYWLFSNKDKNECVAWARNNDTTASRKGLSELKVIKEFR